MFNFPEPFSIKVMGRNTADFEALMLALILPHLGDQAVLETKSRPSRDGNYLSLTVTIQTQSKEQLDAIYRALSAHEQVLMVL
jgi:putative lipoic acid-binding regulatory protein